MQGRKLVTHIYVYQNSHKYGSYARMTQGASVPLPGAELIAWLETNSYPTSVSELSRAISLPRGTLRNQISRNSVAESTVVAIARAFGGNVLNALGAFEAYEGLASESRGPLPAEVMSQIHYSDVLAELLARSGREEVAGLRSRELVLVPHDESVRAWLDAIDAGELRRRISDETGVATNNISTQLTHNRLSPELAYTASRLAGVSLASGLVVTGLISPSEGLWPARAREDALLEASDEVLIAVAQDRLSMLQRLVRRRRAAADLEAQLSDFLG